MHQALRLHKRFLPFFSVDNKSATTAEAAPVVIKATTHLEEVREPKDDVEKHKNDTNDEKISDVMEILQGMADHLQKIEEKMDCRLQKMEEKSKYKDFSKEEGSGDHVAEKSDEKYNDDRFGLFGGRGRGQASDKRFSLFRGRGRGQEGDERFDIFSFGPGRGQETVDPFCRFFDDGRENYDRFWRFPGDYGQDSYDSYGRFSGGRGRGLLVGGRFRGGRCGGQGYCGTC
ncbi:hypothetical protein F2Q70_00010583 [Brassica cretica]|uniref:Uncharacterized protein n=1 Tax=Brassica cretica TaxID=69181 RepID=A0A8S9M6H5_BRACR|nr:hypothetical protein F2Q70_00010583 [Brassica cretica]